MSPAGHRHFAPGWLFGLYLAYLAWLPLPIGSNRPVWIGISLAWLCLVLMLAILLWAAEGHRAPRAFRRAGWAWLMLGGFLAWQLLQLAWPARLSPAFIRELFDAAGAVSQGISIDHAAGLQSLYLSLLVVGTFAATLLLVDSRQRLVRLLWLLVWVGVVLAVVTGVAVMEGEELTILGVSLSRRSIASGPFINRNHFANYLVLALSAGIGLLISMQSRGHYAGWRQRLRGWAETLLGPKARLRIFLALMVITLVLTRSRMGNTAFFASLLVVGSAALVLIRGRQRPLFILIASLVAIDILIVGTWFGVEQVVDRIQKTVTVTGQEVVIHEQARLDAIAESLQMIREAPLTGSGGGTYFTRFPAHRSPDQKFFDHAHNDYLEFAVEYGVPAVLLLGLFVLYCARQAIRELARRSDPLAIGCAFASLMAVVAMGIHATVEFNLQIPANAVTFMALLALPGIVAARRSSVHPGSQRKRP